MNHRSRLIARIIGWALLVHLILILLTVAEVYFYSTMINPGQESSVYEDHAQVSGPYVGMIAGFFVVFLLCTILARYNPSQFRFIALGIPIAYILIDLLMVLLADLAVGPNAWTFVVSFLTKLLAGFLATLTMKKKDDNT